MTKRPRLALPYTAVESSPDALRLVAGEDLRFTVEAPGISAWLPPLLRLADGSRTLAELIAPLEPPLRALAGDVLRRLCGERVLVDGRAFDAHRPARRRLRPEGRSGPLLDRLAAARAAESPAADPRITPLPVLCQDRLDWDEVLQFGRARRSEGIPWLWATTGPLARAFVGPVFLPDAGPCIACLLDRFRGLSPAPEVQDDLLVHARAGRPIEPAPFPEEGLALVADLVCWKATLLETEGDLAPAAAYRLHVVEVASLEVSSHRVLIDPECADCGPLASVL